MGRSGIEGRVKIEETEELRGITLNSRQFNPWTFS